MDDERVKSKHAVQTVSDPLQREDDPWAAFRQVEQLNLEFVQRYRHSLGKYSKFFVELERGKFFATRCGACQKTYAPPRPLCPACLKICDWVRLEGLGTLKTYAAIHYAPGSNEDVRRLPTPYVLAYVLLDGASTLFPHVLKAPLSSVKVGMRVRIGYTEGTVDHPLHLMHFVPLEERCLHERKS